MSDIHHNPIPHRHIHPARQFFIFLALFLFIYIAANILGIISILISYGMDTLKEIGALNITQINLNAVWMLQFISVTMPLLISPIIFSKWIVKEPDHYLKTNFNFPWLLIIIAFVTMMLSNPVTEFLGNLNEKMVLPKFLSGLEKWMRDSEDSAKKISDSMMQMKSIWNMVFDLIFIGLLTALVEEIMFRGCLQTILVQWTKNNHAAV